MAKEKIETPIQSLIRGKFAGQRFLPSALKMSGKILKAKGMEAAVAFLADKGSTKSLPNFKPPAKCTILAKSRPFEEWPVSVASKLIQERVYSMTHSEFETLCGTIPTSKDAHTAWLDKLGLDLEYRSVQGLNKIIAQTINRYKGVIKKVENRNEKRRAALARKNEARLREGLSPEEAEPEEQAFKEDGRLLQPPGLNPSVYGYQQASPFACNDTSGLPAEYQGYTRKPSDELRPLEVNRLDIPRGQPGYVPEHQRTQLNHSKNRRRRAWYANANHRRNPNVREGREEARIAGALLVQLRIEKDWVLLDARGLVRNARWRRLMPKEPTLEKVLGLFSGDPVIDPRQGVVTFTYKEAVVPVHSEKTVKTVNSLKILKRFTQEGPAALVSVDLGQNKFLAAKFSKVSQQGDQMVAQDSSRAFLHDNLTQEFKSLRRDVDRLEETLHLQTIELLPEEVRAEVAAVEQDTPQAVQQRICEMLGLDSKDIPWSSMSEHSMFLADAAIQKGNAELVEFDTPNGKLKRRDSKLFRLTRKSLSKEARASLNKTLWDLKRDSDEYSRHSKRKSELARRSVNWVVAEAKQRTQCDTVVINVEDLNVKIFTGSGKRAPGWENFFQRKQENRWFMQALHKAFCDLGPHRGIPVIEAAPHRTSITCTQCGHCDKGNRDGEDFECKRCGIKLHADLDVATDNLERVALTGKGMPKPACERSSAPKKARGARKQKISTFVPSEAPKDSASV